MTTGEKIRNARKKAGLTQTELASLTGTAQANIAYYENGKRKPKYETLLKIASALNTDVHQLMGRRIEITPDGVYEGIDDDAFDKSMDIIKFKYFNDYLSLTDIRFNLDDRSVAFDNEKYYLTPDQVTIIMSSTETHIKNLIRAIGKKVEE